MKNLPTEGDEEALESSALEVVAVSEVKATTILAQDLKRDGQQALNVDSVACPVLASMVSEGFVQEDEHGKVSRGEMILGLMKTGNSKEMAAFQAKGIVGFSRGDMHQNERKKGFQDTDMDKWVNFRTMNPQDFCRKGGSPNLPAGPCNANVEFQQHAYSTFLRDPARGATALERFNFWFNKPGVMTVVIGSGRVMTLQGLGTLLKIARETGDHSGEFSTNLDGSVGGSPLAFYHPSITAPSNVSGISQWQAVAAWSSFFAAFGEDARWWQPAHVKQSVLMSMFIDGRFPDGWTPKHYGFRETFVTAIKLKGSGAGEVFVSASESLLGKLGREATETEYFRGLGGIIAGFGGGDDDIHRSFPPGRDKGRGRGLFGKGKGELF